MHPSKSTLDRLLRFAQETAIQAGGILKKHFHTPHRITYKGRIDPVTEADFKSEKFITDNIRKKFPDHAILAEEGSGSGLPAEFRWVIDPLDGTVNYAHGFPVYCVSIALEYESLPILGAVYDPERNELFHGLHGHGAFLNKTRLKVSPETSLQRALIATGFGYNVATARRNNLGYFARMVKRAQAVRRPGSAAIDLCWLAAGRVNGFWELDLHPWDTAAAMIFVQEAGGIITQMNGRPFTPSDRSVLAAANKPLHSAMRKALSGK